MAAQDSVSYAQRGRTIAKNTIFLFFRMMVVMLVGLYASRVIMKTLGVEDFGLYNVVGGIVVFFSFLQQALTNATYRFFAYDMGKDDALQLNRTFSMSVNAHLLLALMIFVLCETIGLWFLNHYLVIPPERMAAAKATFHISILTFCFNVVKTPYHSAIIVHEKMSFFALTSIIEAVLKLAIIYLLLLVAHDKLVVYAFLLMSASVLMYVWYWMYCRWKFGECRYRWFWDKSMLWRFVTYSGWSSLVNLSDITVAQAIVFFFNKFSGLVANAALGIANQVNNMLNQFLYSFTQSFNPQIIKSYAAGDMAYFNKLLFSTSKISYYLMLAMVLPLMLNIDFVLNLWLVEVPEGVAGYLFYIVIYSLIDAYSGPLWMAAHATGNIKWHQIIVSSIKILNIPLAYLALRFGLEAWTALGIKALLNLVCSIARPLYMTRLIRLDFWKYLKDVLFKISLVTILTLPFPIYMASRMPQGWWRLLSVSLLSVALLGLVVYVFGLDSQERGLCMQLLKKITKRK